MVFGRIARLPLHIPNEDKLATYNLYLQDLITRLSQLKEIARNNQITAKEKAKLNYDKKVKPKYYRKGDLVYVKKEIRTHKFDDFYNNPLPIVEVLKNNNVLLQLPNGNIIRKHVDKIKLANPLNSDEDLSISESA